MSGGAALRELSMLLARNAELASEKVSVILGQAPAAGSMQDGSARLNARQLYGVLAVAQFLAHSADGELRRDLWDVVVEFLRAVPHFCVDEFWESAISLQEASSFFSDLLFAVAKIADMNSEVSEEVSSVIAYIVPTLIIMSNRELKAPIHPGITSFINALAKDCPRLLASDVEEVTKCALEQWFLIFKRGNAQSSSSETSYNSSPAVSEDYQNISFANGRFSPYKEVKAISPSNHQRSLPVVISEFVGQHIEDLAVSLSVTPIFTPTSTPSKLTENPVLLGGGQLNGTIGSASRGSSLDQFFAAESEELNDEGSHLRGFRVAMEVESIPVLEKQELAFRLSSQILERTDAGRHLSDEHVQQLRNAAVTMLKTVLPLLKLRKQDWPADAELLKAKLDLKLQACRKATILQTKCLLLSEPDSKSRSSLRESFPLSLDAVDVCLSSPWRKLRACEELFDSLLNGVAQIAAMLGSQIQRSVLLRLKSVILATCTQAEVWNTSSHCSAYGSILNASCLLLEAAWKSDKSSIESFLSSLTAHVRERVEQGARERLVILIQTNLISFLVDLAERFSGGEVGEIILPQFIEILEQGDHSVHSMLRLKLIEALARLGSLGTEKSYREVAVLLTRNYLDRVSSDHPTYSRALPSQVVTELLETLANALFRLAHGIHQPKLRSDLRERLLTLCSNVGLHVEAKNGRGGAELMGPLLPAIAEICSDFDPTQDLEPSLLKLFRNLWFYTAIFGLAPPVQRAQSSLRQSTSQSGTINSTTSGNIALQAVRGAYMWNLEWSTAATLISKGTPPLVVSSVKWLEDELELKALNNAGSRMGASSEKAALAQRTALSAAIGGQVEASLLNTVSGVKATYLLAVAFLEILRLGHSGGVLKRETLTGEVTSALICTFKYLETPDLLPVVQQCLAAIVHQGFNAAVSWLVERMLSTEEQAEEREAIVAAHACYLIIALSHREENVRDIADGLLTHLRARFPQVLWNPKCLDELLRLVVNGSQGAATSNSGALAALRVFWSQRVREWIAYALMLAPCTVQGLLQEQFRKVNTWQKASQTSDLLSLLSDVRVDSTKTDGWSSNINIPAVLAAAAAAAGASPQSVRGNGMEVLSTGIISANVKSNYVGEVAGMKKLYAGMVGLTKGPALPSHILGTAGTSKLPIQDNANVVEVQDEDLELHGMLTTRLVQLLQQFVVAAERGSCVDSAAFHEASLRGAALLLSDTKNTQKSVPEGFDHLLRLLCWCPAHIFTPQVMETGVFVWTWLLSAAPHLGSRVLAELVDAWLWTIDAGKGLFASGVERSGPAAKLRPQLSPGNPGEVADSELVHGISAHHIWLGFLLDRYEVVRNVSYDQVFLISRLLQGSVKSTTHFSRHPAASGTFFTLMLLGLKFCVFQAQVGSGLGISGTVLLETHIYRAALGWFSTEPGWYDPNVEGALQAEAQTMAVFVQYLMTNHPQGGFRDPALSRSGQEGSSSHSVNAQLDSAHRVWAKANDEYSERERRRLLLLMLCQCEADRLETWAHPLNRESAPRSKVSADQWSDYAKTAWSVDPRIALSLVARFPAVAALKAELTSLVQDHLTELFDIPEALPYFVTPKAVEEDSPVLQHLPHWAPCAITHALEFLTPAYRGHHRVMAYVLRVMETYPPERVTFFMPQLVQSLRYDQKGLVEGYLMVAAQRSNLFAHILIWQLQGEEAPTAEEASKEHHEAVKNNLYDIVPKVRQRIIDSFTTEAYNVFLHEFSFFDKVTSISGVLYPLPKDERRAGIRRELEKIQIESQDLYLPTAPGKLVRGIQLDSGIPLQSAAKVPIMITFDVIEKDGDPTDVKRQACIFKVGDDCRQDVLALQVIALLRDIFDAVGINLYLFPYGVLPTGYGRGIIEVVPNTRSRNQMAEITDGGLLENFQQDFGTIGSTKFEAARENFIVSSAGYAVASLILQPKDRHNGNLLFDKDGRLVHIDFGFILETSPGGNMRFESAHFKLSHEMTQLLDPSGVMKSEPWYRFVSLCVKGYLTARQHMDGIINTVHIMKDSGLPCFSRGDSIGNLRKRFHPEMSEREAANFMIKTCEDAYNKWTTTGYDLIQFLQQGIEK